MMFDWWSTAHGVFGGTASFVVSRGMGIECHNTFAPIELDLHESVKICIILGSRQIVVSFNMRVSLRLYSGEKVCDFVGCIVVDVSEGLYFWKPLDVFAIVFKPDSSMEGHFIILSKIKSTISSMAFESLLKMSLKTLSKSYSLEACSS